MITQALKHNNKISVSTAAGTRMVGDRLITGKAGTTTVSRHEITEIEDGVLPDDCTTDEAKDVLAGYVLAGDLADAEIEAILDLYQDWNDIELGETIEADTLLQYNDKLYKVLSNHNKQSDWTPDTAVSLFADAVPESVIEEWTQPESTKPYMKGDKVTFEGRIYESNIDDNIWSPSAYPTGWDDLGTV